MAIVLIIGGIGSVIYGILSVLGRTNNDISKDSELDKKLLSEKSRYFMHRYYAGFQAIMAGACAIALGLIIHFS
jgi:hypothetical protein